MRFARRIIAYLQTAPSFAKGVSNRFFDLPKGRRFKLGMLPEKKPKVLMHINGSPRVGLDWFDQY